MNRKRISYISILILCMILISSCGKAECPFEISENAIIYEYPGNNLISLKSTIVDEGKHQCIYEFSKRNKIVSAEKLDEMVSLHQDGDRKFYLAILTNTWEYYDIDGVEIAYSGDSIFLKHDYNEDANILNGRLSMHLSTYCYVQIYTLENPKITVAYLNAEKSGDSGSRYESQEYNRETGKWNKVVETFVSNSEEVGID